MGGDLREGITFTEAPALVSARADVLLIYGKLVVGSDLILVVVELVVHEGLVAVLEDGQVLELSQEDRDVVSRDEETGEEHERNDEDGREGYCELLVREGGRDNEGVTGRGVVDEDKDSKEDHEGLSSVLVTNSEVNDATEDNWSHDREGKFGDDFSPEVRAGLVHIVVDFSEENGSFVRENQDDILDSVEGDVHGDEEEGTLHVLDTSLISLGVKEQEDGEKGSEASSEKLDIGCLGQSQEVEEVSSAEEAELVEERRLGLSLVGSSTIDLRKIWVNLFVIVSESRLFVAVDELSDLFLVLFFDAILIKESTLTIL